MAASSRYIRIRPVSYMNHICIQTAVYGCVIGYINGSPNLPGGSGSSGIHSTGNSGDSYIFVGDTKVWIVPFTVFIFLVFVMAVLAAALLTKSRCQGSRRVYLEAKSIAEHREVQSVEFEFGPEPSLVLNEKGQTQVDGLVEFHDNSFGFKSKVNRAYDNLEILEMHNMSTKGSSGYTTLGDKKTHGSYDESMAKSRNGEVTNRGFLSDDVAKGKLGSRSQSMSSSCHYSANLNGDNRDLSVNSKHSSRRSSMHELTNDDEVTDGGVYYRSPRTTRTKEVVNIKYIKQACGRSEKQQKTTNISDDSCSDCNSHQNKINSTLIVQTGFGKHVNERDYGADRMVDISSKHEDKYDKTDKVVATFAHQISTEFDVNVQPNSGNTLDNENHGTDDWMLAASNNYQNDNKNGQVFSSMNHQKSIKVILDVQPSLANAANKESTEISHSVGNSASTQGKNSGKSQVFRSSFHTKPKEVTMDMNSISGEIWDEGNPRMGQVVVSSNGYLGNYNGTDQIQSLHRYEAITMEVEVGTSKDLNGSYPNSEQSFDASEGDGDRDEEANQDGTSLALKRFVNVVKMDFGGSANGGEMHAQREVFVSNGNENGNANSVLISSKSCQRSIDITMGIKHGTSAKLANGNVCTSEVGSVDSSLFLEEEPNNNEGNTSTITPDEFGGSQTIKMSSNGLVMMKSNEDIIETGGSLEVRKSYIPADFFKPEHIILSADHEYHKYE